MQTLNTNLVSAMSKARVWEKISPRLLSGGKRRLIKATPMRNFNLVVCTIKARVLKVIYPKR